MIFLRVFFIFLPRKFIFSNSFNCPDLTEIYSPKRNVANRSILQGPG